MREVMSTESEVPKPLLSLEAHYGPHGGRYGLRLAAISEGWEKLFKSISGGKVIHWKKNGVEQDIYDLPNFEGDRNFGELIPQGNSIWGAVDAEGGGRIGGGRDYVANLFFLRIPGLSKGVEVFFPGIFEGDSIRKFANVACDRSEALYRKLSPGSVRAKVWIGDWEYKER